MHFLCKPIAFHAKVHKKCLKNSEPILISCWYPILRLLRPLCLFLLSIVSNRPTYPLSPRIRENIPEPSCYRVAHVDDFAWILDPHLLATGTCRSLASWSRFGDFCAFGCAARNSWTLWSKKSVDVFMRSQDQLERTYWPLCLFPLPLRNWIELFANWRLSWSVKWVWSICTDPRTRDWFSLARLGYFSVFSLVMNEY